MGKKQREPSNKPSKNILAPKTCPLEQLKIKKNAGNLKEFLWQCLKTNKISMKTESVLREYVNRTTGGENIETELEHMLQDSRLYTKTRNIFQDVSLSEKYSNLLQGNMEQNGPPPRQQLQQQQARLLKEIKRVYGKYKVNSMFRDGLLKQIGHQNINTLIRKGYLREIASKEQLGHRIIYMAC